MKLLKLQLVPLDFGLMSLLILVQRLNVPLIFLCELLVEVVIQ